MHIIYDVYYVFYTLRNIMIFRMQPYDKVYRAVSISKKFGVNYLRLLLPRILKFINIIRYT